MASCANCGKTFSPTRGDARYCSNRCRLVTFREGVELATIVKHHISFGTTLDGDTGVQQRLRELMNAYPDAVRKLGEPMIRAAMATTLPRSGCRWDLAWMWAGRLDQPKPRLSRAGRTLLGDPCRNCEKRMQPKSSGGVTRPDAGRPTSVRPLTSAPSTRVAPPGKTALAASASSEASRHANCVICGGYPSQVAKHPPWFTSVLDHDRWVASGRPKRWPA